MYQDFISQWSLGNEAAAEDASASQLGLAWLIPLWVDRDQEVWTISVFSFSLIHDNLNIYSNICKLYTVTLQSSILSCSLFILQLTLQKLLLS